MTVGDAGPCATSVRSGPGRRHAYGWGVAAEESTAPGPFEARMRALAAANGWVTYDLNAKRAVIKFDVPSGRKQTLYAIDLGEVVELSVPSVLVFDTVDEVPHDLAVTCLRRSARTKVGFWCLEQIEGKQAFSFMWNLQLRHLDAQTFGEVVRALVVGCDALESDLAVDSNGLDQELHELLGDQGDPSEP